MVECDARKPNSCNYIHLLEILGILRVTTVETQELTTIVQF